MATTLPHPEKIEINPDKEVQFDTLEAKFGNGYSQATPNGLNSKKEIWIIQWVNLTETELQTVEAALDFAGGHGEFLWTPPGAVAEMKFKNKDKQYRRSTYGKGNKLYRISVTLIQSYSVT
jgi:phage-related protein